MLALKSECFFQCTSFLCRHDLEVVQDGPSLRSSNPLPHLAQAQAQARELGPQKPCTPHLDFSSLSVSNPALGTSGKPIPTVKHP